MSVSSDAASVGKTNTTPAWCANKTCVDNKVNTKVKDLSETTLDSKPDCDPSL